MPTYEYKCTKCTHEYEKFEPITAKPEGSCPECGGSSQRKISLGSGIIFKGSGFYTTDYKKSNNKKTNTTVKKEAGSDTAKKSDKKTESKTTKSSEKKAKTA